MSKIPLTTASEAIKAFTKAGFISKHTRGSHHTMRNPNNRYKLSVPIHGSKPLGKGLLLSLIQDAGLTKEEFIDLLSSKKKK